MKSSIETTGPGFNGVNFFQYSTLSDWLTIFAFCGPRLHFRFRDDKPFGDDVAKLIEFCDTAKSNGVAVAVTYTSDLNADRTFENVRRLKLAGITFRAIELGNEEYSQTVPKMSFDAYKAKFEPVINKINATYPGVFTYILCAPPRPKNSNIAGGRADHQTWHDALKAYLALHLTYGIGWHVYYNNKEAAVLTGKPAKVAYNPTQTYTALEDYYNNLYGQCLASNLWDATMDYIDENYSGRYVGITEFGIVAEGDGETSGGAGSIKNTLAYSAICFRAWCQYRNQVNSMDIHSGVALTGMITPGSSKYDLTALNQKRVEFYAFQLAGEVPAGSMELPSSIQITKPGTYYYWFTRNGAAPVTAVTYAGCKKVSEETHYIDGLKSHSTAGYAEWQGPGTVKNCEIDSVKIDTGIYIPSRSFGYVKIVASGLKPKPVKASV